MNNNLRVIEGGKEKNLDKEMTIERIDKNQKVMNIKPQSFRINLTGNQLENIERGILEVDKEYISVTYSKYELQKKQAQAKANELEEMFKDDENVKVFENYKNSK